MRGRGTPRVRNRSRSGGKIKTEPEDRRPNPKKTRKIEAEAVQNVHRERPENEHCLDGSIWPAARRR